MTKAPHVISGGSLEELATAIQKRLEQVEAHIGHFRLDESFATQLKETVEVFNRYAGEGKDPDFHRGESAYELDYATMRPFQPEAVWPSADQPNRAMYPLAEKGPYHTIILAPGALDTNGGPMINEYGQILKAYNRPIKGLYGAGNCIASSGMNAYWGAGATIGPAMTYGYLSALHAAGKIK